MRWDSVANTCSALRWRATSPHEVVGETRYRGMRRARAGSRSRAATPGCFPKGDHVNVGVGGWESEGPASAAIWPSSAGSTASRHQSVESIRGYRLPLRSAGLDRGPRSRAARRRRGGSRRPALRRRDVRGLRECVHWRSEALLELLEGRSARSTATRQRWRRRFRIHGVRLVGREGRARPLSTSDVPLGRSPLAWRVMERMLRGEIAAPSQARG